MLSNYSKQIPKTAQTPTFKFSNAFHKAEMWTVRPVGNISNMTLSKGTCSGTLKTFVSENNLLLHPQIQVKLYHETLPIKMDRYKEENCT